MKKVFFSLLLCVFCFYESKAQFSEVSTPIDQGNSGFVEWGDYDSDGDLDLLVNSVTYINGATIHYGTKIYKNNNGSFSDIGVDLGLFYKGCAAWGDFDGDGDLDLAIMGKTVIDVWGQDGMTKIFRNDNGAFTDIGAALPQTCNGALKWGDMDNDGDLDLVITGYSSGSVPVSAIMLNNKGTFLPAINHGIPAAVYGRFDLADYDKDGYLDVLISGGPQGAPFTAIYKNNKNLTFTKLDQNFVGMSIGSASWGDYDSDGDLDFMTTGTTDGWTVVGSSTKVYRNDNGVFADSNAGIVNVMTGMGSFADFDNDGDLEAMVCGANGSTYSSIYQYANGGFSSYAELQGGNGSSIHPGDYNNDGKLDVFVSGYSPSPYPGLIFAKLYKNTTTTVNVAPTSPTNLKTVVGSDAATLSWNAATDTKTPAAALEYNFYMGTSSKTQNIVPAMADIATGYRRIPARGNAEQNKTAVISKLRAGTYYWSVQAIDGAFAGSSFAAEQTFTVVAALAVSNPTETVASAANSKASINVSSNTDWKISSNQTWLKLSASNGSGDAIVGATADENPTTSKRTATITISAAGVASKTITVTQDAAPAKLTLSVTSLSFAATANSTKTFTITSNTSWTVSCDQAWVTISAATGSNSSTITLTAKENTSITTRSANLTVTPLGAAATKINLSQNAAIQTLSVSPSNLSIGASARSQQTFTITSNTAWTVTCDQAWLSFSKTSGSGNETITTTAAENTTTASRTATINIAIAGNGGSIKITQAGIVTAIEDIHDQAFNIYPNPVADLLHIETDSPQAEVSILSLNGSLVLKQTITQGIVTVSALPAGVYIISISTKEQTFRRKFIKL